MALTPQDTSRIAHLARLEGGAKAIALELPWSRADVRRIVGAVLRALR